MGWCGWGPSACFEVGQEATRPAVGASAAEVPLSERYRAAVEENRRLLALSAPDALTEALGWVEGYQGNR